METNQTPLSGKIDSNEALRAALKELNKDHVIARWKYKQLKQDHKAITDDTFHLWRDELRLYTVYWVKIHVSNTATPVEQDATLHLAKHGDQAFVAFAETEDKRKRDVFTRMRYGKYLTKYHPEIENEDVKRLVAEFEYKHGTCPELRIGETAADFVHAIKDGPSDSCQADKFYSGDRFNFAGHEHPAVCYASGDIAVAWIEDSDGVVKARALINKERKRHSRPYGDTVRIERLLADAGYEMRSYALAGCRLKIIENQNGDGWLMPYVDAGVSSGGGSLHAERNGDYWMLNDNDDGVNTSCGYENRGITTTDEGEEPECGYCDRCSEGLHSYDDYAYSEHRGVSYCTGCADRYWQHAIVSRNRGDSYNFDYVGQDECTYIDCLNEYALDDIIDELDVVCDPATDKWIKLDDAVQCVYDEEYHHFDSCVEAGNVDGEVVYLHKEDLKDKNLTNKIYYDESGDPFWYESDEIQEWIEEGTNLDEYVLKSGKESGQEALPLRAPTMLAVGSCYAVNKPFFTGTCPEGTWQEIYRWMQARGVRFEFGGGDSTWWAPENGLLNFDALAESHHYRIQPDQVEPPNWRDTFIEAQRCGAKFEVKDIHIEDRWSSGLMQFNGEKMADYRIQEVTNERIAA